MKRKYVVQLIIDFTVILMGFLVYFYPLVVNTSPNMTFFIIMCVYAGLEMIEYLLYRGRLEPLCFFFTSLCAACGSIFLREFNPHYILSITIGSWVATYVLIKLLNIEKIYIKSKPLVVVKALIIIFFTGIGLATSFNMFYKLNSISYLLAFLFICYGAFEFGNDYISYLSDDNSRERK